MAVPVAPTVAAATAQIELSKNSLINLKCGSCQGYLSVPPITMVEREYACGRCISSGNRVLIYEELAKFMIFPCKYEKCKVQLPWGQVDFHERFCPQRTMICPFNTCSKTYLLKGVLQHFKALHKEYIYDNESQMLRKLKDIPAKIFAAERKLFLFLVNAVPFVVIVGLDSTSENQQTIKGYKFTFGVFSLEKSKLVYDVNMEISSTGSMSNYELNNKEIKPFDQRLHCLKCMSGNCTLPGHNSKLPNKKKTWLNKINIDNHGEMNATYKITIHEKEAVQAITNTVVPIVDTITMITCFCRELMFAPIFVCVSGHSLCMNCKKNMSYCPVCRQTISDTRNLALEEISETMKIPCRNSGKGCKYSGLVKSTKQHLMDCKYNSV